MAASQLMAAIRALTTLAMPRPMPAAAAHSRASGHENPALVGSNGEGVAASRRANWYPALINLRATSPHNMPIPADNSFHIRSRPTSKLYPAVKSAALNLGGGGSMTQTERLRLAFERVAEGPGIRLIHAAWHATTPAVARPCACRGKSLPYGKHQAWRLLRIGERDDIEV